MNKKLMGLAAIVIVIVLMFSMGVFDTGSIVSSTPSVQLRSTVGGVAYYVSSVKSELKVADPLTSTPTTTSGLDISILLDPWDDAAQAPQSETGYFTVAGYKLSLYVSGSEVDTFIGAGSVSKYDAASPSITLQADGNEFSLADYGISTTSGPVPVEVRAKVSFNVIHITELIGGYPIEHTQAMTDVPMSVAGFTLLPPTVLRGHLEVFTSKSDVKVTVTHVDTGGASTKTSVAGLVAFEDLPVGDYTVDMALDGYVAQQKAATVTADAISEVYAGSWVVDTTPTPEPDPDPDPDPDDNTTFSWSMPVYVCIFAAVAVVLIAVGIIPGPIKIRGFVALVIAAALIVVAYMFGTGAI